MNEGTASTKGRAIVTGAGSGIGQATAQLLEERGYAVVGFDLNAPADGSGTVEDTAASLLGVDVADEVAVAAGVARAVELLGGLDTLVNAAGITERGDVVETEPALWDSVFGVNVRGPYLLARACLPHLRVNGGGTIINVGSQFGLIAAPGYVAYCASKAAVLHLTRALAVDHASEGIRVNAVCPGPVDTPMSRRHVDAAADPAAERERFIERTLNQRFATPHELAQVIAFLASDEAEVLHGATIAADAGYSIH